MSYLFFLWMILVSYASSNECPPFNSTTQIDTCTFRNEDGVLLNIPAANCSLYNESQCCFDGKRCYNKPITNETTEPLSTEGIFEIPISEEEVTGNTRTILGGIGGCGPPTKPKEFPDTCKFTKRAKIPYVFEPPTDVPYCVRIPCSTDATKQAEYDKSIRQCGIQPGCYFDQDLAALRNKYGESVMPGVPICHFAIRNLAFHKKALKVVDKYGFWNPYFTFCTLETFEEEIYEEPIGCKVIPYMETAFKIGPKSAGWKEITSKSCRLIGGCWRSGRGCFYPAKVNEVNVKSGQRFSVNPLELRYGRPLCQPFNTANPYEVLKSIHQCYAAGCSVDEAYVSGYYALMYKIGEKMPNLNDHWIYWSEVLAGNVNHKDVVDGLKWRWTKDFKNDFTLESLKPTIPNVASSPQFPATFCDPVIRFFGRRPCAPKYTPPSEDISCPFKPLPIYSSLKGSLKGCCDINPCYLSKQEIAIMHSGPSYYYTEWGRFGPCSARRGNGVVTRKRKCLSHDEALCTEPEEERTVCGNWLSWGGWSNCPFNCATHQRTRRCSTGNNSDCRTGLSREVRRCNCPFFGRK